VVAKPDVIQLDEKAIWDLDAAGGLESGVLGNGSSLVAKDLPILGESSPLHRQFSSEVVPERVRPASLRDPAAQQ
jgi:hypothetical protein